MVLGCLGQGACQQQTADMCGEAPCPASSTTQPTRRIKNTCWGNGVKVQEVANFTDPNAPYVNIVAQKNGVACYTMTGSYEPTLLGAYNYTVDDGLYGARLAYYGVDPATGDWSIDCPSGNVDVPARCHPGVPFPFRDPGCTAGTCSWD